MIGIYWSSEKTDARKTMMRDKKSQAAMEFMVTYGWVILGVMIVIGALAYYGIFSTDKYINDECNFGTQLYCEDFKLLSSGILYITFRNNFGQAIYISDPIKITIDSTMYDYGDASGNIPGSVPSGSTIDTELVTSPSKTFPKNEKIRMKVIVPFNRGVIGAPSHNITGTIVATAND